MKFVSEDCPVTDLGSIDYAVNSYPSLERSFGNIISDHSFSLVRLTERFGLVRLALNIGGIGPPFKKRRKIDYSVAETALRVS